MSHVVYKSRLPIRVEDIRNSATTYSYDKARCICRFLPDFGKRVNSPSGSVVVEGFSVEEVPVERVSVVVEGLPVEEVPDERLISGRLFGGRLFGGRLVS